MDKWSVFSWLMITLALAGTFIIAQRREEKHVYGFWLWAVSNMGLVAVNVRAEIPAQAMLFTAYLGLSLYGIWKRRGHV